MTMNLVNKYKCNGRGIVFFFNLLLWVFCHWGKEDWEKEDRNREREKEWKESDMWSEIWLYRDWERAGELDVTVTNRSEQHVCVWVDLAGCLYARLKIESDSRQPTIPQLSRWLPQCVRLCVCFGLRVQLCDREITEKISPFCLLSALELVSSRRIWYCCCRNIPKGE